MLRPIAIATLIAGTLDILFAFLTAGMAGTGVFAVLRFVASGPFGRAPTPTLGWALVGLAVHFAIMACMAAAYLMIAPRFPVLLRHPILAGFGYGVLLWIVMYWIVMPLRWDTYQTPNEAWPIVRQLISHCLLTGLPIAWIAARMRPANRPSYI